MAIQDITQVLTPPAHPFEQPVSREWMAVENRLGTSLPDDYKAFIEVFGSGTIDSFLWVLNPFSSNPNLNLEHQIKIQADVLEELASYGEAIPFKSFPEKDGILPFAMSDNGDVLYWQTSDDPAQWKVVANESRGPDWAQFDLSMTDFLAQILKRQLVCTIFPDSFPSLSASFTASR